MFDSDNEISVCISQSKRPSINYQCIHIIRINNFILDVFRIWSKVEVNIIDFVFIILRGCFSLTVYYIYMCTIHNYLQRGQLIRLMYMLYLFVQNLAVDCLLSFSISTYFNPLGMLVMPTLILICVLTLPVLRFTHSILELFWWCCISYFF